MLNYVVLASLELVGILLPHSLLQKLELQFYVLLCVASVTLLKVHFNVRDFLSIPGNQEQQVTFFFVQFTYKRKPISLGGKNGSQWS